MKHFSKITLAVTCLLGIYQPAEAQWANQSSTGWDGNCPGKDYILNTTGTTNFRRFGIVNNGNWGGTDQDDMYIHIGLNDLANVNSFTPGVFNSPVGKGLYGLAATMNSDRMFVGLRYIPNTSDDIFPCNNRYTYNNRTESLIAWGNDDGTDDQFTDRLIFEFHRYDMPGVVTQEIATMVPSITNPYGSVGIGTQAPTEQLHTNGGGVRFETLPGITYDPTQHDVMLWNNADGVLYHAGFPGVTSSCTTADMVPKSDGAGNLSCSQIYDNGTTVAIATTTGSLGGSFAYSYPIAGQGTFLGSIAPVPTTGVLTLDINGVVRGQGFLAYSDRTLKTNIKDVQNSLAIINKLEGKTYDWNDKAKKDLHADNGRHVGFIAQDLAKVVPEVVIKDDRGVYSVNYTELIPILTEGIKEQQKQIEELKEQVASLQYGGTNTGVNTDNANTGSSFKLYPNPTSSQVSIELSSAANATTVVMVTDLNGRMIKKLTAIDFNSNIYRMEKGVLGQGIYLVTMLQQDKEVQTSKLIVTQ